MERFLIAVSAATLQAVEVILADSDEEDRIEDRVVQHRNENFFEETVPNYSDGQFKEHFRLKADTFENLLALLAPLHGKEPHPGQPEIKLEKKLLMAIWYIANCESFRGVSDRFGVSKSCCWCSCTEVFKLLVQLNSVRGIIAFPSENRAAETVEEFEQINGFPGILGAIDGCHIRIEKPKNHGNSYVNRKGFPSVLLQGICDSRKQFLDIYTGEPGSIHDYRLFTKSDIYQAINRNQIRFPNNSHLVGDLAYKLSTKLMVGYKDNGQLTPSQILFNKSLNKNRVVIENAFGLLKCRFRRLKMLEARRMDLIPLIILSCCILHSFLLKNGDFVIVRDPEPEDFGDDEFVGEQDDREAHIKGENIKNLLYMRNNNAERN